MAELLYAWDAEFCPDPLPDEEYGGIAHVYIGGTSAAHVWNPTERARVAHLPRIPIWVPTPGSDNPRQAALECARVMRSLGLRPVHEASQPRKAVMVDLETGKEPDRPWQQTFCDVIHAQGFGSLTYASSGIVYRYEARLGYVVAQPDGVAELPVHPGVIGKQWRWSQETPGGPIDQDVYDPRVLDHLWV